MCEMEKYTGGIKGWLDVAGEKISELEHSKWSKMKHRDSWSMTLLIHTAIWWISKWYTEWKKSHIYPHTLTRTYCIIPFIKFWKMQILCSNRRQITSCLGMRRAGKGGRERGIGNIWIHYLYLDDHVLYTFVKTHQTINKYLMFIVY